jgi:peptidoglycan L-alanyl-D-glutamate endopeptidase CwlK
LGEQACRAVELFSEVKKYLPYILIAGIAVMYMLGIKKINQWIDRFSNGLKIDGLHPAIREAVKKFLADAEAEGIFLKITDGMRTFVQQDALYAQGRTTAGKIVTNAKSGQSFHNYGLAVDVVPIVNGKADWEGDWAHIGRIGKAAGLDWGGDFTTILDRPHFQYANGNNYKVLFAQYHAGKKDAEGFVKLA